MAYETITTKTDGAVTTITLNRPQALNALSSVVLDELIDDAQGLAISNDPGPPLIRSAAPLRGASLYYDLVL